MMFCLCPEKWHISEMLQHVTGLVFVKGSTAARKAKGFRRQNDTVGAATPVATWRALFGEAVKDAPIIDLDLQWISRNSLVLTILLEKGIAQPKACKHLAPTCLHMLWMPASKASYGHYPMKGSFAYLCHLGSEYCLYQPRADDKKGSICLGHGVLSETEVCWSASTLPWDMANSFMIGTREWHHSQSHNWPVSDINTTLYMPKTGSPPGCSTRWEGVWKKKTTKNSPKLLQPSCRKTGLVTTASWGDGAEYESQI